MLHVPSSFSPPLYVPSFWFNGFQLLVTLAVPVFSQLLFEQLLSSRQR